MTRAAIHPSLPQNDTPAQKAAREAQIATACASYVWTTDVPTLPGVPLAATVPASDEPTIPWFLILIAVGLKIARNVIAVKLAGLGQGQLDSAPQGLADALARCDAIEASATHIAQHHTVQTGSSFLARGAADAAIAVEYVEHDAHLEQLKNYAAELRDIAALSGNERLGIDGTAAASLDAYRALFDTIPVPGFAYIFEENDQFARLRVAGPNAMLIQGISALPANFPVTAKQYEAAIGLGDTLERALAEGRVYLSDYAELAVLVPGVWKGLAKYVWQPLALFAVPPGGSALKPVAIQCGQDSDEHPIFTPTVVAAESWGWEIAKTVVQVADGNYHELFVHLARTHLVMEACAVATHRELAAVHPLWALLVPHFEGSLFINNQAATSLIAANGPIDHIFGGTITSSQLAAASDRLAFDFYGKMLHHDLVARNVADTAALPDYPYRDDALLVWQAIHEWATQYIDIYYANDAAVTGDTELAAWVATLASDGKLKGFRPIVTRAQLADVCTMILFTASAQHAAVNFPQKDIMSFAPAVTGAGWTAAPMGQTGHDKAEWLGYLPPVSLALEQLNVLYLLGSVHYRALGDYRSNDFPYLEWFRDPAIIGAEGPLARFQASLRAVDARIVARNAERQYPYPYLQPSLIPTSVNI
ncbi:arachidonate 15-lipoxygenase [Sphingomonas sp. QA11]|uniref:lipoxygenase family protein n=1 Tax=Sphingomonas sp. QA11 TaxID=2950605 RepID=UPI002349E6CE|nr:lipoxygenase family protein [Sphingomonas sp. QA11]WCM27647.1 arachidonate 15-lipoxygenase [Sphingomonas sp. QA11]